MAKAKVELIRDMPEVKLRIPTPVYKKIVKEAASRGMTVPALLRYLLVNEMFRPTGAPRQQYKTIHKE